VRFQGKIEHALPRNKRRREDAKPVTRLGEAFDTYHPAATAVKGRGLGPRGCGPEARFVNLKGKAMGGGKACIGFAKKAATPFIRGARVRTHPSAEGGIQ